MYKYVCVSVFVHKLYVIRKVNYSYPLAIRATNHTNVEAFRSWRQPFSRQREPSPKTSHVIAFRFRDWFGMTSSFPSLPRCASLNVDVFHHHPSRDWLERKTWKVDLCSGTAFAFLSLSLILASLRHLFLLHARSSEKIEFSVLDIMLKYWREVEKVNWPDSTSSGFAKMPRAFWFLFFITTSSTAPNFSSGISVYLLVPVIWTYCIMSTDNICQ